MAGIVQRAMNTKMAEGDDILSDEDKELLFSSLKELDIKAEKEIEVKEVKLEDAN
jgi:hypothetical protein